MLTRIRNRILQIQKAQGLEISLLPDGERVIHSVTVRLEKNKVVKENELVAVSSLSELVGKSPPGPPVGISINGKGVLHKTIAGDTPPEKYFETILPNANPNEFYLEATRYDDLLFVCVIRKEVLDKIVADLIRERFRLLSVSLGTADFQYLLPYLNMERQTGIITSNHYAIRFGAGKEIAGIEAISFFKDSGPPFAEYSIGNQYIYSSGLFAFGSAMGLLAGGVSMESGIGNENLRKEKEEFRYYKYYRAALWTLLTGVFGLLLINFFIYNYYFNKNAEWQVSQSLSKEEEKRMARTEEAIRLKEHFIDEFGWSQPSRISFYADRIAALVPETTVLTGIKINPVNTGFFGETNLMRFKQDTIQITGTCEDPTELNRFANNLRNIQDFRTVVIRSYLYKKETQNGIFSMEIITI